MKSLPSQLPHNVSWRLRVALRDGTGMRSEALTSAFTHPCHDVAVGLRPVASGARRRQVEPVVNTAARKRTHMIHLRYNHLRKRGVTVGTGPVLRLLPPSQNVTTGGGERGLRWPKRGRGADGASHRPHGGGAISRHRAVNCGGAPRCWGRETGGGHAVTGSGSRIRCASSGRLAKYGSCSMSSSGR